MIPAGAIKRFQSTLPAREATSGSGQIMCPGRISIHASCKGSDHSAGWCRYPGQYFNPRFPRGKRLSSPDNCFRNTDISIHASRGGSDTRRYVAIMTSTAFQSTLPAGEATALGFVAGYVVGDFNPRFPRGKRRYSLRPDHRKDYFNPRFPRGKRRKAGRFSASLLIFQSTLPAGEATRLSTACTMTSWNFNPRFPRGKRPWYQRYGQQKYGEFQSTLPAGEATKKGGQRISKIEFQSTLPAGEAT